TPPPATPWPQTPAPEVNAPGASKDDTQSTPASPWAMESGGDLPPTTEIPIGTAGSVPPPPDQAPSWAWGTETPGAAQSSVPPTGSDSPYGAPYGGSPYGSSVPPVAGAAVATTATREKRGGVRSAIVGGIAGAVVGALIAGGIVAAVDDNPKQTPVQTVTNTTQESARPAAQSIQPGNIKSILNAARPAVVRIDVGNSPDQPEATGTGFIIDSSGVIVTNAHVVDGFNDVTVHLANGDEATGKVIGADSSLDLAVVKISKTGLPTLQLGDSDSLQVGDGVV